MTSTRVKELKELFQQGLEDDILFFWLRFGLDRKNGGYFTGLDRHGGIIETDKSIWFQGRFAWVLSTAFLRDPSKQIYLLAADSGIRFLLDHGFAPDGRMYYRTSAAGTPLIKRRYYFSELFAVNALVAFSRTSGETSYMERARKLLRDIEYWEDNPKPDQAKWLPGGRNMSSLAHPMIMISVLQEMRRAEPERRDEYTTKIKNCIESILPCHIIESEHCLVENLADKKPFFDHNEGRQLNPGHAMELVWFILMEFKENGDLRFLQWGQKIFSYMWDWGWDNEYGGFFYFRDALGHPSSDYWHDMKFWWPHTEAAVAALLLHALTGDPVYEKKFDLILDWTLAHFPDTKYGEWFGYLHRDGSISSDVKGNMFKGPFHIPRMQLVCLEILESGILSNP